MPAGWPTTRRCPAPSRTSAGRLSLREQVFAFLGSSGPCQSESSCVKDTVRAVLRTLDDAGGPCRASGVFSLVRTLASIAEFNAAVWVIEETARRASNYNVLMAGMCKAGDFQGAREVFDEMTNSGCLLCCMLKNGRVAEACELVEAMERSKPDVPHSLTHEILAYHACKAGRMDSARRILDQMFLEKLTPRITIHTAFIKGYLCTGRTDDAFKYVTDVSTRDRHSVNRNYSLLVKLLHESGRIVEAGRLLYELMEKGLRPDHSAYVIVANDLHRMGRGDLPAELKSLLQRFGVQADLGH